MKLKNVFNLIYDCYIDIFKVNPDSKNDSLALYDDWINDEKDLTAVLKKYGEYPVVSLTCWDLGPTIVITIDNP
jgi:hypothetical protein